MLQEQNCRGKDPGARLRQESRTHDAEEAQTGRCGPCPGEMGVTCMAEGAEILICMDGRSGGAKGWSQRGLGRSEEPCACGDRRWQEGRTRGCLWSHGVVSSVQRLAACVFAADRDTLSGEVMAAAPEAVRRAAGHSGGRRDDPGWPSAAMESSGDDRCREAWTGVCVVEQRRACGRQFPQAPRCAIGRQLDHFCCPGRKSPNVRPASQLPRSIRPSPARPARPRLRPHWESGARHVASEPAPSEPAADPLPCRCTPPNM